MRALIAASLAAAIVGGAAFAEDGPPRGCFHRLYSDAHLAQQPAQIVREMTMVVMDAPSYDEVWADLTVVFADQGRLRGTKHAGQSLQQGLNCYPGETGLGVCAVDCDGGFFEVTKATADSITIKAFSLTVGPSETCGGSETLSEIEGKPTVYRLNRVDDLVCGVVQ